MTALNKQALREAAQEEIMLRSVSDTSDAWQDEASPEAVLALLDELEAKDKRNAELEDLLEAEIKSWMQRCDSANNRRESAERRIAELEARKVTVKLPADYRNSDGSINDDMFNTCAVVGAFRDALAAAGIGVKGE
ncbi:ead/Ea22-like family protein [Citrobacter freundii]|uniref:ead/Ea22-like family protein n=1 Tax=Citrobacter freundii TaxID=546 RepID=UPI002FE5335F